MLLLWRLREQWRMWDWTWTASLRIVGWYERDCCDETTSDKNFVEKKCLDFGFLGGLCRQLELSRPKRRLETASDHIEGP